LGFWGRHGVPKTANARPGSGHVSCVTRRSLPRSLHRMWWRWAAAAVALLLVSLGAFLIADRDDERAPPTAAEESKPAKSVARPLGALAPLKRKLERRYAVEVVAANDLPARPPLIDNPGLPSTIRATEGLVVSLTEGHSGHVYGYRSNHLAMEAAPSFLGRNDPSAGVSGCGRTIYFGRGGTSSTDRWYSRVSRVLRQMDPGCSEQFMVIE
jgi:hypothetical protein